MIVFWIVVALFLLGALLFLLPGLLARRAGATGAGAGGANVAVYRDQLQEIERDLAADLITKERYEQARAEIERRVLEDTSRADAVVEVKPSRITAGVLGLLIPLASIGTYLWLGQPEAVSPEVSAPRASSDGRHEVSPEQIQRMVAALAERLKAEPNNFEGWVMLGRSYTALGRYRDAAMALRKADELQPRDADLLADLADVLGMAQGRKLAGEPARVIQQALDIDPKHVKALALAGSVAFEAKDYAQAKAFWERLLAVVPADSEIARSVRGSVAEAAQLASGGAAPPAMAAAPAQKPAAPVAPGAERVSGEVVLDPKLASKLGAGDTLFVYARAVEGPRVPLAIARRQAGELPYRFSLDDSMSMAPNFKLSGFQQVMVEARVSRSGQATPQSGDLMGQTGPVAPGTQGLKITIDRVQP
ncbi:MAG: c-type cytochrome biogenesis protein CcmI [Rubrivivax sp.]